ncbi:hypothetical protein WN48_05057 [Eufriesea mexicana]|nr:hypothetical protein WN48_05057 [Eufriesea mexicana]
MSRLRGSSSTKEGSKVTSSYPKERSHEEQEDHSSKSYKNSSNRYHFGMTRQQNDEVSKNGRDYKEHANVDADLLYKKSKEHFGAWDIKDIVPSGGSVGLRKQTDRFEGPRLTNGRSSRNDSGRQDRYDDHEDASSRDDRGRTGSIDREQAGTNRSRKKESWESPDGWKAASKLGRTKSDGKDEAQRGDERDQLLKEIENLAIVDGRSPDRRIKAMIERFKSREEDKSKSRKERVSLSPEKEEYRSKSGGRGEVRTDHIAEANDRDRGRAQKDDREDERRSARSKLREAEKYEQEETSRSRSVDRRTEKSNDAFTEKRNDAYVSERNHRRPRDVEDDVPRRKDSPKRRSYVYDGNPEDFDVRIQRYERALLEPRRDAECVKRVPLKDSDVDHDRQVTRKSSFKSSDGKKSHSRDRESSLSRKTSFKELENDSYRKNCSKSQDVEKRYFGRDPEHVPRKSSSSKEQSLDVGRKNSFKEQSSDYGRISSKTREDEEERKRSFKGHTDGVSRITFKEHDADSGRIHLYKDPEPDVGRVSFKDHSTDVGRKNSLKEKSVEFGGISYKDHDEAYKPGDSEPTKVSFRSFDEPKSRHSPNGRYVEFGSVCFQSQDESARASPANDQDYDPQERRSSLKGRDSSKRRTSPRSKNHEAADKRSDRHSRPLTPPKRDEPECREDGKDREEFDSKSWHESNRIFAAKYFRENSAYRANPEGRSEIDRDPSPEMGMQEFRDGKEPSAGEGSEIEDAKASSAKSETHGFGNGDQHPRADLESRYASTRERNGATIIRIRTSPEMPVERRRRRLRPAQDSYAGRRRWRRRRRKRMRRRWWRMIIDGEGLAETAVYQEEAFLHLREESGITAKGYGIFMSQLRSIGPLWFRSEKRYS